MPLIRFFKSCPSAKPLRQDTSIKEPPANVIASGITTSAVLLVFLALNPISVFAHEGYGRNHLLQQRERLSTRQLQQEPPEFELGTPGVCRLYNLSGYLAMNADGQMVPLKQYCQQQRSWVWYETDELWERFRDIAAEETIAFTQTLNQDRAEAYAQSICPFLEEGGTLQELAEIQADQQFSAGFEQAITIAAVRTYCPQYRANLQD